MTKEKSDESYLKEKYMEMQYLSQHLELIQQQLEKIDEQINDVMLTDNSLMEFSNVKNGSDIMVSIANGIFAKASLSDNGKLLVNVGNNVIVEKDIEQTRALLKEQMDELEKYKMQLAVQSEQLTDRVQDLESDVEKRVKDV